MTTINAKVARRALIGLPEGASYGEKPSLAQVYLPPSHLKAMDLNRSLVIGMRGAGKTFWWSALQTPNVRRLIDRSSIGSALKVDTEVRTGFGVAPRPDDYPKSNVVAELMSAHEPRLVWRTVLARHLASPKHPLREIRGWSERVEWVSENAEAMDRLFYDRDNRYDRKERDFLILFDALDLCANKWSDMYRAIRGLLQLALDMRAYRRLRVKIFLRSDQVDESRIADFPDASKVLASKIELSWPRRELYGLLWQLLANGKHGKHFRKFLGSNWKRFESQTGESVRRLPRELADEDKQKEKFDAIAGKWMGANVRRGFPYTWVPNHLGDTQGNVSPRSFLVALRTAAEDTRNEYREHPYALHYNSIKRGVSEASRIRVDEIREDYPWVERFLAPLSGMSVPCEFDEVADIWRDQRILKELVNEEKKYGVKLLPRNLRRGIDGVRDDLESLGIFQRLLDGRVNMPDVFRVGYGLGRKGGVKPVR